MLDTNTVSYIASGASPSARQEFGRLGQDRTVRLSISALTEAEIRYGMTWAKWSSVRRSAMEGLLAQFDILPWDSGVAVVYGDARAKLRASGLTMDALDMLIAAHASAVRAVLVTHDSIFIRAAEVIDLHDPVDWATDL
jgi:tRNA(fMet)-specific endonuclease VapC